LGQLSTLTDLTLLRSSWKAAGNTVVWTNGCFDLLHAGHVQSLKEAKAAGDILIVGINSDRSVKAKKGPSRPVVPEEQRAEIVAALECVDYVVIFDDESPRQILNHLRPDVHCKGADYADGSKPMPEAEVVHSYGGRIEFLSLHFSCSTTRIIDKIRRAEETADPAAFNEELPDDNSNDYLYPSIVDHLARARVLIVGDIMLDEYVIGNITRISPEAPVPILDVIERRYTIGGAANVANNTAGLGAKASLIGLIAEDAAGRIVCQKLRDNAVSVDGLITSPRQTTCKTRYVAGQQQLVRVDQEDRSPICGDTSDQVLARFEALLSKADVCVVSDYGKGLLTEGVCQELMRIAVREQKPVIVDPKGRRYEKYRGCTVITPNLKEAALATGIEIECEADLYRAADVLLNILPGTYVLITRGPGGMTLFRESHEPLTIATVARSVFDVVGAGDTAVATLAVGIGAKFPIESAIGLANLAAGIVVEKHGTVAISIDELTARSEVFHVLEPVLSLLRGGRYAAHA
jgi:rfaE bifunctional protein kinase chain/domain/rfaE bifunctional protein nucleotidyltransferase chain/domain